MTSEAQADGGGLGRVSPWQAGRREKSEPPASCQGAESSGTLWCPRQAGGGPGRVGQTKQRTLRPQAERRVWLFLIYVQRGESGPPFLSFLL